MRPPPAPERDLLHEAGVIFNLYNYEPQLLATLVTTVAVVASIMTCFVFYTIQYYRARRRRRENALAVRLAETAPVNDDWDHEVEKQSSIRNAALTESDDDEAMEGGVGGGVGGGVRGVVRADVGASKNRAVHFKQAP